MYLISPFSNTSYSPYCLCALPACFPEMFGSPNLSGRLAHSVPSLSQSSLHICLFLNTVTENTAVCCLHNPARTTRVLLSVCYRMLLTVLQVIVSRAEPPTTSLFHDLCPSGLSKEAKSLLSILDQPFNLKYSSSSLYKIWAQN